MNEHPVRGRAMPSVRQAASAQRQLGRAWASRLRAAPATARRTCRGALSESRLPLRVESLVGITAQSVDDTVARSPRLPPVEHAGRVAAQDHRQPGSARRPDALEASSRSWWLTLDSHRPGTSTTTAMGDRSAPDHGRARSARSSSRSRLKATALSGGEARPILPRARPGDRESRAFRPVMQRLARIRQPGGVCPDRAERSPNVADDADAGWWRSRAERVQASSDEIYQQYLKDPRAVDPGVVGLLRRLQSRDARDARPTGRHGVRDADAASGRPQRPR